MGSPQTPTPDQIETLETAGQLELLTSPEWITIKDGKAIIPMFHPRQAVSLIKLDW
jgi:xylan 1,4-beta-xylosidase